MEVHNQINEKEVLRIVENYQEISPVGFLFSVFFSFSKILSVGESFSSYLNEALFFLKSDFVFPMLHSVMQAQTNISSCTTLQSFSKNMSSIYLLYIRN